MEQREGDLIESAKRGDREAFESLMTPYLVPALRLAYGGLGDRSEAEDAVQEAVLTAWRRLGNLRPGASVGGWFYAIVANRCRRIRRSSWWRTVDTAESLPAVSVDASGSDSVDLRRAIAKLNVSQRLVIVMHYYLDMPIDQIASANGMRPGTVKSHLSRARGELRSSLSMLEETQS